MFMIRRGGCWRVAAHRAGQARVGGYLRFVLQHNGTVGVPRTGPLVQDYYWIEKRLFIAQDQPYVATKWPPTIPDPRKH